MLTAMSLSLSTPPSLTLRPSHLLSPPRFFPSPLPNLKSYERPGVAMFPMKCLPGPTRDVENSEDAKEMPTSSSLSDISSYSWCAALGGVGFVETAYLTYIKLTNSEAFCPVGGGSCSDVLNSDYASVLGVPLPLIGMTAYGFVLLLGLKLGGWKLPIKINESDGRLVLLSVTSSMAAASAYFLYTLSTKFTGASCSYCLASAVLSFSLFFIILKDFELEEIQKVVALPLCTASIVLAVLNTSYSSLPPPSTSSAEVNLPYYATEITGESSPFAIALARHLHSIGAKMYGAFWCSHCQEQKEMFGREAAKLLDYVECFPAGYRTGYLIDPECSVAGIEGFPTWVIKDEVYSGEKKLEELAQISGFDSNKST